jgi:hypothetical protein
LNRTGATITADASAMSAAVEELGRLIGDTRDLPPYLHESLTPLFRDMGRMSEIFYERGQAFVRPSPEFLAALASLRAIRGLRQPVVWMSKPEEA